MKKAQVTVFIIVGLFLLLSVGVLVYVQFRVEVAPVERERPKSVVFPADVEPVRQKVVSCVVELAKDGLRKIGVGGGYLDASGLKMNVVSPTEGEAVEFAPGSRLGVPFWFFLKDENSCTGECEFATKQVSLVEVEQQLDGFIEDGLSACVGVGEFEGMSVVELGKPVVVSTIAQEDVFFTVEYPLRISRQDQVLSVNQFVVELPFNFREVYNFAAELTNLEVEHRFLEKHVRQLIDAFGDVDGAMLPPVSDLRVGLGPGTVWAKFEVERRLRQILASYVPMLQVMGSRNHRYLRAPEGVNSDRFETLYNRGMIVPLNSSHPGVEVKFHYLDWWRPFVDLNCRGQVCRAESMAVELGFSFGLQRYQFAYDVSVPVVVELRVPGAFGGEGYSFFFGLEANVRDNAPMPAVFVPLRPVVSVGRSMFCDDDKLVVPVRVSVIDARSQQPVRDAVVGYSCAREGCLLDASGEVVLFPPCLGGFVRVEKEGYHPAIVPLSARFGEEANLSVVLEPYRLMSFDVEKFLLKKGVDWELDLNNPGPLAFDEEVFITLERNGSVFEEPLSVVAQVKGGIFSKEESYNTDIRLIPGVYMVRAFGFKYAKEPVVIPRNKRCVKAGALDELECFFVPENDVVFDERSPLPTGGAEFVWVVTPDVLELGNTVRFKTIAFALETLPESRRRIEDLEQLGRLQDVSAEVREQLEPVVVFT